MRKDKFIEVIETILKESDCEELISFSTKKYEIADLHIMGDFYLAHNGEKWLSILNINEIAYTVDEARFVYSDSFLKIFFELEDEVEFIVEFSAIPQYWIVDKNNAEEIFEGDEPKKFYDYLKDYDYIHKKKNEIIDNIDCLVVGEEDFREASVWSEEAKRYIKSNGNQNNIEIIYVMLANALQCEAYNIKQEIFSLNDLVGIIIEEDQVYKFIWYLRDRYSIFGEEEVEKFIVLLLELVQSIKK